MKIYALLLGLILSPMFLFGNSQLALHKSEYIACEAVESASLKDIEEPETSSDFFECTLSITGYGNIEGVGRVPITLTATAATCDEASANLRPQIIEMELRLYE